MSEKEILEHLRKVIELYRSDFSALKQEYEQKIQTLNEENKRLIQQSEKDIRALEQKCQETINRLQDDNSRLLAEKNRYKEGYQRIHINLDNANKKINERGKQIQYFQDEKTALQQDYRQLNRNFDECRLKIEELERENQRLRRETIKPLDEAVYGDRKAPEKKVPEYEEWPLIFDAFNRWAANPTPRTLPSGFSYVEGEFRIRSKNDYRPSSSDGSKWIVNTKGGKKYLLPNPLSFDLLTNISELYHMDMSRLQASNNKIKIVKPCELLDEGYINYPGELTIL
jgi:predicted nuclease with TOPRIM domain